MGKSPYQASLEAADEIGLAVIAISLTIVAVFVPASFMQSIPGQFFKQFGITVSIQVLFSLLCARLITPMLAAYFLKPHQHEEKADGPRHAPLRAAPDMVGAAPLHHRYRRPAGVRWRHGRRQHPAHRVFCLPRTPRVRCLPSSCRPARGSPIRRSSPITLSNRLRKRPEVESVFVDGGRIPPDVQEVRKASLTINYVPKGKRSVSQQQLEQSISRELADDAGFPLLVPR